MGHLGLPLGLLLLLAAGAPAQEYQQTPVSHVRGPSASCYNEIGMPQRCIPEFENAAFEVQMEADNTCGESGETRFCIQTGTPSRKSCDTCTRDQFASYFLTDLHHEQENQTWWQSETMNEGIQYPNQVNLTLNLGKTFDITYVRLVFYSPRPESFAIYKRTREDGNWEPYQYYSATCRETYKLPDSSSADRGAETRALCTSEYSDISPLKGGNVAFSTLEGRPSAYFFDTSADLQEWVTATDIRITLDRLNTFGDEVFADKRVLQSYWYAIADVAVGARCKCNGHAYKCDFAFLPGGKQQRICQCQHNTAGPDCNKCADFYNDAPWGRATQHHVHECKACNCNGYSDRCFFDPKLYNSTGHGGHCLDCTDNRDGPNCERCKQNYHQPRDNVCTACDCNPIGSRSLQCNSNGKCQCKPGVTGEKCDRCQPNHYEFTSNGCTPCGCSEAGSFGNLTHCDSVTGLCHCKEHVEGKRCRECKPGYFNLDVENEYGCTPCFCYGHSAECQSAMGYSKVVMESSFSRNNEKWSAQNDQRKTIGIQFNAATQNIAVSAIGTEHVFFVAPDRFLGDQRSSYNHDLKFNLKIAEISAYPSTSDIILEGAGTYVAIRVFEQGNVVPSKENHEYVFHLHEHPRYGWSPKVSARGFMSILSNLTAIKIRGTYGNQGVGYLDNVRLETAQRGAAGNPATWIEMCSCPEGYVGQFCESCAPGYRHNPALGGPFKPCVPCDCNGHADICDSETGRCICQHNTSGDNCELCQRGYYGNALSGTAYDCTQCPCPLNGACIQMADTTIVCTECPNGYAGIKCDLCSDGYFGDPTGRYGPVMNCKPCECNLNVDPNAVGNCNRTTGECLKCIHNTAGAHCDQCLPGFYGDALAPAKSDCKQCECNPIGTMESNMGTPQCDPLNGQCACRPHVIGRNCEKCQDGYFNIDTGDGCESCNCNLQGSFNNTCNILTGQCSCRKGITGLQCDMCIAYQYGFSEQGCNECMCDHIGSKGLQCDPHGQCPCYDNVEGKQCDRCKENKHDRQRGCVDCPPCYNLVQDAVNSHRVKLQNLQEMLRNIEKNPTVIPDSSFESQLKTVKLNINALANEAKLNSGASDGGKSLLQKLGEFNNKLENIQKLLDNVYTSSNSARKFAKSGNSNITSANEIIESSRRELDNAMDYLVTDGVGALAKAQNRSDQLGQQSTQMSIIAQESRLTAEKLEREAKNIKETAESAQNTSSEAYKLAKGGIGQQTNISSELSSLAGEILTAEGKLNSTLAMAAQSLSRSVAACDSALEIFAQVNSTVVPKIDTAKIKTDANTISDEAKKIQSKVDNLRKDNDEMISALEDQINLSNDLLERGTEQQGSIQDMLSSLDIIHKQASDAVQQGNTTLEDARNIYNTLKSFHEEVQISRTMAQEALDTKPEIDEQVQIAEEKIKNVEESLELAKINANSARDVAQEAQKKFAKQASEEAHSIREKAAATKQDASTLHDEAGKLAGRVDETKRAIEKEQINAKNKEELTNDAMTKVGQAKLDADEVKKLVNKALKDVQSITEELERLPILDDKALDNSEGRLRDAELELTRSNLSAMIQTLQDKKNSHQRWLKQYEEEAKKLKLQVDNVKDILDALPSTCFKRTKLEP